MNENDVLRILQKTGALLEGHFLLSSGLHSDRYVQCAKVLQYPDIAERLGTELANMYKNNNLSKPDIIASPAIGGIVIGQEIARALKVPHIFIEKDSNGKPSLRRGFSIQQEQKFIVVEDVITTGKSTNEVIKLLTALGGHPIAILTIIDRKREPNSLFPNLPLISLAKLDILTYKPDECPLCKKNLPLIKPGSRKIM